MSYSDSWIKSQSLRGDSWFKEEYLCNSQENISSSSIDFAKHQFEQRREYLKIRVINRAYKLAKALGFPDKVKHDFDYPRYVSVQIPSCFNKDMSTSDNETLGIPIELPLESSNIHIEFISTYRNRNSNIDISGELIWFFLCMQVFYKRVWCGGEWIDEQEKFKQQYSVFSDLLSSKETQVHQEIMEKLVEKLAKNIDREIVQSIYNGKFPEVVHQTPKIELEGNFLRMQYGVKVRPSSTAGLKITGE